MKKANSNTFLSTFNKVVVGTATLGSLGVGAYFIYNAIAKKETEPERFEPNVSIKPFAFSDLRVSEGFKVKPYLGREGLEALIKRFKEEVGYGPEIVGLNSINITDGNYVSSDNNGEFYESTKEIFINSNNLRTSVPGSAPLEDRVDCAFQTIYHEYGHFIASSYLKNNKPGSTAVADIYLHKTKLQWSKYFVDKFKHMLHYDVDTPLYQYEHPLKKEYIQKLGGNYDGKVPPEGYNTNITLLPHLYNVKQLFDIANSANGEFRKNMPPVAISGRLPSWSLTPGKLSSYKYLYSMDELYTRKYMQIGYKLHTSSGQHDGWVVTNTGKVATTFLTDTLRYRPSVTRTSTYSQSDNWQFYPDSPYGTNKFHRDEPGESGHMWSLMLEEFGQSSGADISYINVKNASHKTVDNRYIESGNSNLIKFGGFVSHSSNYNFVGYIDDKNKFRSFPITRHAFHYGYKDSLTAQTLHQPMGENDFYAVNDYIDLRSNNLLGKELYFSDDAEGTNKVVMKSTRDSKVGKTSSWFQDSPRLLRDNVYSTELKNGKVYIRRESWS